MYDLFSNLTADQTGPGTLLTEVKPQPEEQKTIDTAPQPQPVTEPAKDTKYITLDYLFASAKKIGTPEMSYPEFVTYQSDVIKYKDGIIKLISACTMAQLGRMFYFRNDTKKTEAVEKVYNYFLESCNVTGKWVSYSPFEGQTYEGELMKILNSQTEETYNNYIEAQRAEFEAKQKALNNPETIEEYRIFVERKGRAALTPEQSAKYDELLADRSIKNRERDQARNNIVKAVEISDGVEMQIKTSYHAKKKIPLWVVVLSTKVEREQYEELNKRAKMLGGYYSSYRGAGAIPGFTFENEEAARLFVEVKNGDVDKSELTAASQEERTAARAESLSDKAQAMAASATEELNRDRKDNTARRARMAASAEARAMAEIEFAQTAAQIAEGITAGTIKYLTKVQNLAELETLYRIINSAKYRYKREKNVKDDDFKMCVEVAEFIKYPYPSFWKSNVLQDLGKLQNEPGKKMAAARLIKGISRVKDDDKQLTVTGSRELEDYETVFCYPSAHWNRYDTQNYKEMLMHYKRVQRLQLQTMPELRAACRELIGIMISDKISPEQRKAQQLRELDRKFIDRDIPGFFPTPAQLGAEVVALADIQENDTILEPSAGLGHLADQIREVMTDNNTLVCIECNYSLAEALRLKGYHTLHEDFLQHPTHYDKIIMNPPFENGQDIAHIRHAYELLNPGGRLVCIMANNKNNSSTSSKEFTRWAEMVGAEITENPEGSFLSGFRRTGVSTITVVINK